jgi:hypothetical protein
MTALLLAFCMFQGQAVLLPNAPEPVKAVALNVGLSERVTVGKNRFILAPTVGFDVRFMKRLRAGVSFSHEIQTGNNSILGSLNVKIAQWGKTQ